LPDTNTDHVECRRLALRLAQGAVSGDVLAREFGMTRAVVWKRVETLRVLGLDIRVRRGCGYALAAPLDLLDAHAIRAEIPSAVSAGLAQLDVAWSLPAASAWMSGTAGRTSKRGAWAARGADLGLSVGWAIGGVGTARF